MRYLASFAGGVAAFFVASAVAHAGDPKFSYGKYEDKKEVEWKASASAGLLLATGNANQLSFTGAAMASRNDGKNRLQLDIGGAYARATTLTFEDTNKDTFIGQGEIGRQTNTSTALWNAKLRYDRFFSANNLGYLTGFAWGNEPAGKRVVAGAQAGYSRQLVKTDMHLLVAELGYDFSYEKTLSGTETNFYIHSLRLFVGYTLSVSKDTNFLFDIEYLGNMNRFDGPYGATVDPFEDSRVLGRAALTTRIWKKLSFRLAFQARFDHVPAPLSPIGDAKFAPGYFPRSETLDTLTDASLVVTFL